MQNTGVNQEIPLKRMGVYEQLGIDRYTGRILCKLLGYRPRVPLNQQEIRRLESLVAIYKKWNKEGYSILSFAAYYPTIIAKQVAN